jgi:hypothetical protein
MGFFSFLDNHGDSIISDEACDVVLLHPSAGQEKQVDWYNGYGKFFTELGEEIEIFHWICELNYSTSELAVLDYDEKRSLGIFLNSSRDILYTTNDGRTCASSHCLPEAVAKFIGFQEGDFLFPDFAYKFELEGIVADAVEHRSAGRLTAKNFEVNNPLKIAKNQDGKTPSYEDCPPALDCPEQGLVQRTN